MSQATITERVLTLIPARGGSKGILRKNARSLAGKSLLQRSIEHGLASKLTSTLAVSSEDKELLEQASAYPEVMIIKRPASLASDEAKSIDVVLQALDICAQNALKFDAVCLLQPTSPFRDVRKIDEAISKLFKNEIATVLSVQSVPHEYNPHWVFLPHQGVLEQAISGQLITRRQDLPKAVIRDGAIYVNLVSGLRQNKSFVSKPIGYVMDACTHQVNIDTTKDWELAEKAVSDYDILSKAT